MGRTSDAKERLRTSAGELFHEQGYNATGVSQICSRAGVNKGSFYHFYPSKQQLACDVVDAMWLATRSFLETNLYGEGSPLARLDAYFAAMLEHHRSSCRTTGRQSGCPLGNLALEAREPLLRDRIRQALEGHIFYFERLLREAVNLGELPEELDPRQGAEALVALIEGKILLSKARNDAETLADLAALARRLLGAAPNSRRPFRQ